MSETEQTTKSLLNPTSIMLEMHLEHILESCEVVIRSAKALRKEGPDTEKRDGLEGELYAAIFHLEQHVRHATKEWDKVIDAMPDDDDED